MASIKEKWGRESKKQKWKRKPGERESQHDEVYKKEGRKTEQRKKEKKKVREGTREKVLGEQQPCCVLQVFSSPSLCPPPPPCLPHRGDLDLEECAPCSVSGENRGGERKELLTASPTSCCLQKSYGISSSFVFLDACRSACNITIPL